MPKRATGVERLRQIVRERVQDDSLRTVAAEIGMSPSGLDVFLRGSRPHRSTVEKITNWARALRNPRVDAKDVDAAIALLKSYIKGAPTQAVATRRLHSIMTLLSES